MDILEQLHRLRVALVVSSRCAPQHGLQGGHSQQNWRHLKAPQFATLEVLYIEQNYVMSLSCTYTYTQRHDLLYSVTVNIPHISFSSTE